LIDASTTFTADNDGRLPGVVHGGIAQSGATMLPGTPGYDVQLAIFRPWCTGWQTWDLSTHNTNSNHLVNPAYASLALYVNRRAEIFKCPADRYLSAIQKSVGWTSRVRSYSASTAVGDGNAEAGPWNSAYMHVKSLADMVTPAPSSVFVYIEEHADSMNDPGFWGPAGPFGSRYLVSTPANYHDGASTISFGDGRAELHRWKASIRTLPVTMTGGNAPAVPQSEAEYLFDRTPKPQP
jgi:hypothetical protein